MVSPRFFFKCFLSLVQPFHFHPGVSQQFMMVFPVVILRFWRPKKIFSLNLAPFSSRFMILAYCHPLIIVFDCENSFHPSGAIHESFQFDTPKAIISGDFFVLSFQLRSPIILNWCQFRSSPYSSGASFKVFSNQLVISSFSCTKFPSSIFAHSLILTVFCPLFFNCFQFSRWFVQDFLFLRYHINLFVVSILPVVRWRPSQVCTISLLILSTRISSMPNPLLDINLSWWRIHIT